MWFARLGAATALWLLAVLPCSASIILLKPPAKYDHPFRGQLVVKVDVTSERYWGYTFGASQGQCVIHLRPMGSTFRDQVLDAHWFARLKRHEIAHCNSWARDHAGGKVWK